MPVKLKNINISSSRLSDRVKDLLKEAVINGSLKPGEKLPTEEQIAGQLNVSKVTVREALREMETQGLIEKRRGIHGGSFVSEPSCEKISGLVLNYIQVSGVTPEHLTEFRMMLEPQMIALSVERRSAEDLVAIRACIEAFEESLTKGIVERSLGIEFHRLVAEACHNPLISAVMAAVVGVFEGILATVPMSIEDGRIDLDFCKRFYECLVHGQKQKASRLMKKHFEVLSEIITRTQRGPAGS